MRYWRKHLLPGKQSVTWKPGILKEGKRKNEEKMHQVNAKL